MSRAHIHGIMTSYGLLLFHAKPLASFNFPPLSLCLSLSISLCLSLSLSLGETDSRQTYSGGWCVSVRGTEQLSMCDVVCMNQVIDKVYIPGSFSVTHIALRFLSRTRCYE